MSGPLDAFHDKALVDVRQSAESGLWYAVASWHPDVARYSWLDFSSCAKHAGAARAMCAQKMRNDARGVGKYAPHAEMRGYYLSRNLEHWHKRQAALKE